MDKKIEVRRPTGSGRDRPIRLLLGHRRCTLESPIFGREAPGFSHGDERPPRDVEIKKRLLQTGPILVGSGHAAEDTPSETSGFQTATRTRREALKAQPGQ